METTGYFPASCFGKLPSFGDFVRHNASGREALAFDQWIRQGMYFAQQQLRTDWERSFMQAPPYDFLFYPESPGRLLVGAIQPSRDKSQRRFPFIVSLLVDEQRFGARDTDVMPVVFSNFFVEARDLIVRAMDGFNLDDLIKQTQNLSVPVAGVLDSAPGDHQLYLQQTSLETFFTQMFGSFEDPKKYLIMKNLNEILGPFNHRNVSQLSLGLRFPLSMQVDNLCHEVSFWTQLCCAILETKSFIPTLFWGTRGSECAGVLFVFFRQPSPKNLLHLLRPDIHGDNICLLDVDGSDKLASITYFISQRHRALLDSHDVTLKTLLEQIT